jgi:GntR family transcriptional regulator
VKLWIAKNSEVPVHEQIVTQVMIAIASGDISQGERVPSTGEIARRFDIHTNTVSAAYQRLVEEGALEFRAGKGYFVAVRERSTEVSLESIVADALQRAQELGFDRDDIIRLLDTPPAANSKTVLVIESDEGLREILLYELRSAINADVRATSFEEFSRKPVDRVQLTAMSDEKPKIDPLLTDGRRCIYLKNGSVADAMKGQIRPAENEIIAVASGWNDFLTFARVMLLAARIEPGSLIVRSTRDEGWLEAVSAASLVICDPLTANVLERGANTRVFRIIADDSLKELADAINPSS